MSWSYLPELVAGSSPALSSGTRRSARSRSTATAATCCSPGSVTASCHHFPFGTTSGPSTGDPGVDSWISSLAASRVRTSRARARASASTAPAPLCGRRWRGWFAKYDHASCSWRTAQGSLLEGWAEFSGTWPRSGTVWNGMCSERITLAPRTAGSASGCLPTPTAQANMFCPSMRKWPAHARLWPTPVASDATRGRVIRGRAAQGGPSLGEVLGGKQNPMWIEWLMGWPMGWTAIEPLATDRFRRWQRAHGGPCLEG